jgi:hypothetical protein
MRGASILAVATTVAIKISPVSRLWRGEAQQGDRMVRDRKTIRTRFLQFERCEQRVLSTLVFVLSGNAFSSAGPSVLTASAARTLREAGTTPVQLAYPTMSTRAAFDGLVAQVKAISRGQPIGIVGFSAGGSLALRMAASKALNVVSVLDYYGPPDLQDYLSIHGSDRFARYTLGHAHFTRAAINLFSGPIATTAHVVSAFGLDDRNVVATQSVASLQRDLPGSSVYDYPGPHGVGITASRPALNEFLANL